MNPTGLHIQLIGPPGRRKSTAWFPHPGCSVMPVFLDYHASTPIDPRVRAVINDAMDRFYANPSSESHAEGWRARDFIERNRGIIADALGCGADELLFTSGATEANNLAILGAALGAPPDRRRILVGATEHKAVLEAALSTERQGFTVEIIPVNSNGLVNEAALRSMLAPDVAVVSVMLVNNEVGTIQPIRKIARTVASFGAFFHTDAAQAPAAVAIDLVDLEVDAASFSSHKVYGPKGIGALYLSAGAPWKLKPLMFGGGQEGGLRPGTLPTELCAGFAKALSLLVEAGEEERDLVRTVRDHFWQLLQGSIPHVSQTTSNQNRHPGNLHVRFEGVVGDDLLARVQPHVSAATGSACTSGAIHSSHVLRAIGLNASRAAEGVRFSVGRFSTLEEMETAALLIASAVSEIRAMDSSCDRDRDSSKSVA